MIALALAVLLAQAPAQAQPAAAEALPAPLKALAGQKRKDGTAILTDQQREALSALPAHTQKLLADAADAMMLGSADELAALLSLELTPQALELVATDNCLLCHADPKNQKPAKLFSVDPKAAGANPLLDLREVVNDVHFRRGLSCAGCHGGKPTDDMMTKEIAARWPSAEKRKAGRGWIPEFCARCHADPSFMRGFNPAMPTDQLAKYKQSRHGELLLGKGDSKAAQCVSCHGVHGIRSAKSRRSTVHPQRVPETCGKCHADPAYMQGYTLASGAPIPTDQLEKFKGSVHGRALLEKGDLGAPACNACHGNHASQPPEVASVAQVCRRCHAQNGILFDSSGHKKAFERNRWPECAQCHGHHGIEKPTEALIGAARGTLCGDCHAQHAAGNAKCNETAQHFRGALDQLAAGRREVAGQLDRLADLGLDVEPLARGLSDLDEALVQSRSKVHSFEAGTFDQSARPGAEALAKSREILVQAQGELRFRRGGLLGAIGLMGLLAIGLALKVRQLDRRRARGSDDQTGSKP